MNAQFALNDPEAQVWRETLARLVPYPTDENGLRVNADQGFDKSHRHYSHLLAIYPYHTLTPEQGPEARELIERSVNRWQSLKGAHAGYSFTGGCAMYATLGDGNRALETLDQLKPLVRPNTMYYEGGGQVVETPLSAVESINYLLLQSWGGVLRIFPAAPDRWKNAAFQDLRAEGAFLVSAALDDGVVGPVTIRSEAGNTCTVLNPWTDRVLLVEDEQGRAITPSRDGDRFSFATDAGRTYTLKPGP
jgi:hypothetical protein